MDNRKLVVIPRWQPHFNRMIEIMNEHLDLPEGERLYLAQVQVFGNSIVPFVFKMEDWQLTAGPVEGYRYTNLAKGIDEGFDCLDPVLANDFFDGPVTIFDYTPTDLEREIVENNLVKNTVPNNAYKPGPELHRIGSTPLGGTDYSSSFKNKGPWGLSS